MAVCAVYGCKNKKKRRREHGDTVTYHRFPKEKDADAKRIRLMWISRCKRNDDFNADTHRICSNHFTEEDYERDLKNELLGLPVKRVLKKTAVPSINLPGRKNQIVTEREKRFLKRKTKSEISDILAAASAGNQDEPQLPTLVKVNKQNVNNVLVLTGGCIGNQADNPSSSLLVEPIDQHTIIDSYLNDNAGNTPVEISRPNIFVEIPQQKVNDPLTACIGKNPVSASVILIGEAEDPLKSVEEAGNEYYYKAKYKKLLQDYNTLESNYAKFKMDSIKKINSLRHLLRYYERKDL